MAQATVRPASRCCGGPGVHCDVPSLATPVLLTNLDDKRKWRLDRQGPVEAGDPVATVE